jgi:hypothetical protein
VEREDFVGRQREIQIRTLRDYADQPLDCHLLLPNVELANPRLSAGGTNAGGENPHRRGLARAVGPKKAENLSRSDLERQAVERRNLSFGLLGSSRAAAWAETASGSEGWRRVIDLAQIYSSNAYGHRVFRDAVLLRAGWKYNVPARRLGGFTNKRQGEPLVALVKTRDFGMTPARSIMYH